MVDLKNEAHNVYENSKRQLEEFRSKIPADVIENIEKTLAVLAELKDKDLQPTDAEAVKKSIEDVKQAVMKIGSSMSQSSSTSEQPSGEEKKEEKKEEGNEEKKN